MKRILLASAVSAVAATGAFAGSHGDPVKIGVIMAFTGPLESLAPPIADAADIAVNEINESGAFMGGSSVEVVRADSTCSDSAAATAAAERLVTSDGVTAIFGAMCSGPTGAILQAVSLPNGIVQISPSATIE